jgi:hypothetical protein
MKTKMIVLLILTSKIMYAQDTIARQGRARQANFSTENRTHVFSVSPMSRKTAKVDGLVLGFGHIDNKLVEKQTINGLNVEINPAPVVGAFALLMGIMYLPESLSKERRRSVADTARHTKKPDFFIPDWDKTPHLKLNGVNISSGCFFTNTSMNGLNISFANKFKNFNGLSIAPLGTMANRQNGISVGLINANNDLNGFVVGAYNQSYKLDGLQIGLVNQTMANHGVQIGLFNRSYSKGFQIGIWNKNARRSLPILNW